MKLGQKLFKKNQSIWGKPLIAYDQTKMDTLFTAIQQTENSEATTILSDTRTPEVSLETELYLMLNAQPVTRNS